MIRLVIAGDYAGYLGSKGVSMTQTKFAQWAKIHDWILIGGADDEEYIYQVYLTPSGSIIQVLFGKESEELAHVEMLDEA